MEGWEICWAMCREGGVALASGLRADFSTFFARSIWQYVSKSFYMLVSFEPSIPDLVIYSKVVIKQVKI